MSYPIAEIEGIGETYAAKLTEAGIKTTDEFLEQCATPKGRKDVESKTGISGALILTWTNRADLMRIKGIGKQFSELLEAAGVDTVKELRQRRPDNLTAKMAEVNEAKKLSRTTPSESQVTEWIEQAKTLDAMVSH